MTIQTADGREFDSWQDLEDAIAGPGGSGDPFDDPSADTTPGGGTSTGAPGPSTVSGPSGNGGGDSGGAQPTAGGRTRDQQIGALVSAFGRGDLRPDEYYAGMLALGFNRQEANNLAGVSEPAFGSPLGGPPAVGAAGSGAPGGVAGTLFDQPPQPEGLTDFMERLQPSEAARNFALGTGVSPEFRDLVTSRGLEQFPAFLARAALDTSGFDPTDIQTSGFRDFLGQGGGRFNQTLRDIGTFLGQAPGEGSDIGTRQDFLTGLLTNAGETGFSRFAPLVSRFLTPQASRAAPGARDLFARAQRSALENLFARQPDRFATTQDFINFLANQGSI